VDGLMRELMSDDFEEPEDIRPGEHLFQYYRRKDMEAYDAIKANYVNKFTVTFDDEGGKTSVDEFNRMRAWLIEQLGPARDDVWTETGDSIGYSCSFWVKDPNIAALFKLSFTFA
jgi:hypothetical protein